MLYEISYRINTKGNEKGIKTYHYKITKKDSKRGNKRPKAIIARKQLTIVSPSSSVIILNVSALNSQSNDLNWQNGFKKRKQDPIIWHLQNHYFYMMEYDKTIPRLPEIILE